MIVGNVLANITASGKIMIISRREKTNI